MKKTKGNKQFYVPNTKVGMGDSYGTGIKNNIGKSLESAMTSKMGNKKLGKPPKSLA